MNPIDENEQSINKFEIGDKEFVCISRWVTEEEFNSTYHKPIIYIEHPITHKILYVLRIPIKLTPNQMIKFWNIAEMILGNKYFFYAADSVGRYPE